MKTPKVIYLIDMGDEICWCDDESPSGNEEGGVKYIRADSVVDTIKKDKSPSNVPFIRDIAKSTGKRLIKLIKNI